MNKNMHLKLETANQDGVTNWPLWSFLPIPFASFRFHHTRTGIAEKIYVAAWRLPILFPLEAIGSSDFFNGSPQLSTWATYIPGTPPRMPSDGLASIEWGWDLGPSNGEDLYPLSFFLGKWGGHTLPKTIGVPKLSLARRAQKRRTTGMTGWTGLDGQIVPKTLKPQFAWFPHDGPVDHPSLSKTTPVWWKQITAAHPWGSRHCSISPSPPIS